MNIDNLDFVAEIQAPMAIRFDVYDGESVVVQGEAIAFKKNKKMKFLVKVPRLGLTDYTDVDEIRRPLEDSGPDSISLFICDWVIKTWFFAGDRFEHPLYR